MSDILVPIESKEKKEKKENNPKVNVNIYFYNSIGLVSTDPNEIRMIMKDVLGR